MNRSIPLSRRRWRLWLLPAALGCAAANAQTAADEPPAVTPYRPSVSTPAALSAPGWLEFEAGAQIEHGSGSARTDSLPVTAKLAFTPNWGVRVSGDAWVRQRDDAGARISGVGDSSIVLKRRFEIDDASAFGLEAGATFPTARRGLGSGKSDYTVVGIYSADIGTYHTDLNLGTTRIGAVDPGAGRAQTAWAASLSKTLSEQWGVVGEFSGTNQRGAGGTSQFLVAASYNVSRSLTLDAGFSRSLRSGVPDRAFFAGFTILGPRLF